MKFETEGLDRAKFARITARAAPNVEYCIYFTPRSGSSWLTDLAGRSGFLGAPKECFNPNFAPRIARNLGARDMDEYIRAIRRHFAANGTFGFEITFYQLRKVFGGPAPFMAQFGTAVQLWLIREDVVLQAVSLWKMRTTGISHSVNSTNTDRTEAEARVAYDPDGIAENIDHIVKLETLTEKHFTAFGLDPIRLSYEVMMANGPARTRAMLAHVLGLPPQDPTEGDPTHTKIATSTNGAFAERFRAERRAYCADLDARRAAMLAQVTRDWSTLSVRRP